MLTLLRFQPGPDRRPESREAMLLSLVDNSTPIIGHQSLFEPRTYQLVSPAAASKPDRALASVPENLTETA